MLLSFSISFWKPWPKMVYWIGIRIRYQTRYAFIAILFQYLWPHFTHVLFPPQCRARAANAISGVGSYIAHGYFNYQYYAQSVFGTKEDNFSSTAPNSNTNILVIRNEHIADDWNKINILLEGHYGVLQSSEVPRNNVSQIVNDPIAILGC